MTRRSSCHWRINAALKSIEAKTCDVSDVLDFNVKLVSLFSTILSRECDGSTKSVQIALTLQNARDTRKSTLQMGDMD